MADGGDQSGNLNNIQTKNKKIRFLGFLLIDDCDLQWKPNFQHATEIRFSGFRQSGPSNTILDSAVWESLLVVVVVVLVVVVVIIILTIVVVVVEVVVPCCIEEVTVRVIANMLS